MSGINGIGNTSAAHTVVSQPIHRQVSAEPTSHTRATDKLELSGVSHLLKSLKSGDVRTEKVAAVRAQIDAGTYENEQKLDIAVDRLLDDLAL